MIGHLRAVWHSFPARRIISATLVCLGVSWAMPDNIPVLHWLLAELAVYFGIVLLP